LAKQINLKRPGLIIQAGVAGCFDKNTKLATVVAIKQDAIADQGVAESKKFKTVFDLGLISPDKFPYKNGWLLNSNKALIKGSKLKAVNSISVNQVTTSRPVINYYRKKYAAATETMEGAALHYACLQENIPFLQIRSLSNYIGERNKGKWKLKEAIQHLNVKLIELLQTERLRIEH
jgi:futalosine hydrolase